MKFEKWWGVKKDLNKGNKKMMNWNNEKKKYIIDWKNGWGEVKKEEN